MDNQNYIKYQKYKNKYLNLKNQIGGGDKCDYNINNSRSPSNCDRIIYKSTEIDINFEDYKVISEKEFNLIKFSDHKMIYGIFNYNEEKYMIISWNIGAFDHKFDKNNRFYITYIESHIEILINNIIKTKDIKYLIFSFQESTENSLFIKILKNMINSNLNMQLLKHILSKPNPLFSKFFVQLLVFTNNTNTKINNSGYYNLQVNNYVEQTLISKLLQNIKNLFGTKAYVYIKINNLMIVSTHFPIDVDHKDLGNSLRILALEEIDKKFEKEKNLIIIGDLNFRKLNNIDQLDDLLKEKTNFKEAGELLDTTCKYDECKLICNNSECEIHNK